MKNLIMAPVYIIVILAVGMISGHFTFQLLSFSRPVAVPDLRGKGIVEANDALRGRGLHMRLAGEDYDIYVPQGHIIRQDIPPGHTVKEGREIRVVLSRGLRVRYVPDVVGQSLDAAKSLLEERGIRINRVIYVHADNTARDTILAQRPEPNEKGMDSFSVIVSLGDFERF
jgi:serine/threonine-protein kinase